MRQHTSARARCDIRLMVVSSEAASWACWFRYRIASRRCCRKAWRIWPMLSLCHDQRYEASRSKP